MLFTPCSGGNGGMLVHPLSESYLGFNDDSCGLLDTSTEFKQMLSTTPPYPIFLFTVITSIDAPGIPKWG